MYDIEDDDDNPTQKELEKERKLLAEEMQYILSNPVGRRFLARVAVQMAGSDTSTFSPDPAWTAYAQGKADIGRDLRQMARDHNLHLYFLMEEEHYGRNN